MKPCTKILAALLAAVMLLSPAALTGCKRRRTVEKSLVDHAYRVTTLDKPEEMSYARNFFRVGDRIFFSYMYRDPDTRERKNLTYSFALDGTDLREDSLSAMEAPATEDENLNVNVAQFLAGDDGTFWRSLHVSHYDETTHQFSESYFLQHLSADGSEIFSIDAEEFWGPPAENSEESVYHYIDSMSLAGDGVVFIDNSVLYQVSGAGELIGRVDVKEALGDGNGWIQQIVMQNGSPVLMYTEYNENGQKTSLFPLDMATGTLGAPHELDSKIFRNVYNYFYGEGYTFYFNDNDALYGYDMTTGTVTTLMNFVNSDVTSNVVSRLIIVSPDLFIANGFDNASGEYELFRMERIPDEEQIPKYILTIAAMDTYSVQEQVIRFNRQSDEYRIVIRSYSPEQYYSDGEMDYEKAREAALTALNNDIIAGNIPDILAVDAAMQMDSYIAKGMFVDLYARIDEDERFSREDFLVNVLDALSVNGKLYELAPSFSVQTLAGKRGMIGERSGWTMKEFVEWSKTIPEGSVVFYDMTRDQLLEMFCTYAYEEFVDPDTGKCSFDSEDFKLILEYVNTLSTESIWNQMGDGYDREFYENYENRFREDKAMLEQMYLSSFSTVPDMMAYTFFTEEDLVLVGLPSADRTGSVIRTDITYAISAQSLLADGAWAFVSSFLTEDYQDDLSYNFPIRKSSLEKMADSQVERAQERKKQYEEQLAEQNGGNGNYGVDSGIMVMPAVETTAAAAEKKVVTAVETTASAVTTAVAETAAPVEPTAPTDSTASAETAAVETTASVETAVPETPVVRPTPARQELRVFLDREMADDILDFIGKLNHVYRVNTKVNNIIKEDAAAYFAGKKSLEETVKLIQNRVSILVAESR